MSNGTTDGGSSHGGSVDDGVVAGAIETAHIDGEAVALDPVDHDAVAPNGGNIARTMAIVVGFFVAALVALFTFGGGDQEAAANRLVGNRVPEIKAEAIDGRVVNIDNFRGQWVVVNFFATWCPPCLAEHPDLVRLEEWGEANGRLEMLSIAFNDSPDGVQAFFDEQGGSWPVLDDAGLSVRFQIAQIPESFLIAPSGLVFRHYVGGVAAEPIIEAIEANDG